MFFKTFLIFSSSKSFQFLPLKNFSPYQKYLQISRRMIHTIEKPKCLQASRSSRESLGLKDPSYKNFQREKLELSFQKTF